MTTKTHTYRGQTIYPCERAPGEHRGRWIVQAFHTHTGMPWGDEECPHYASLAAAREAINEAAGVRT